MTHRPNRRVPGALAWLPALAYMGVIFWLSSLPGEDIHLPDFRFSDKAVHFLAYAVLGFLLAGRAWIATGMHFHGFFYRDRVGLVVGILYGISDEIHQLFVPGRMFGFGDIAADALGAMAGIWIYAKLGALFSAGSSARD